MMTGLWCRFVEESGRRSTPQGVMGTFICLFYACFMGMRIFVRLAQIGVVRRISHLMITALSAGARFI
jgi:hypothetical protein